MKKQKFFKKSGLIFFTLFTALFFADRIFIARAEVKIEHLKQEVTDINRKINENKEKILEFTQKEAEIIDNLNKTEESLNNAQKRFSEFQTDFDKIDSAIISATAESALLVKNIQKCEDYASRRMVALYKLNCSGTMNLLASAESVNDFFQRKAVLQRILNHDENIIRELTDNRKRLSELIENLEAQKKNKIALEAACKEQVEIISREKTKREAILSDIRNKKSLALASVESLKRAEKALDQKIKILSSKKSPRLKNKPFTYFKGMLRMPVKGEIVSSFGLYTDTEFNVKNFQSGIDIQAKKGDPIHAARDGEVVYASWFKGYGNMLIIDHGGHCHTVYAHADKLLKSEGDQVKSGEVIATVGDTGSLTGPSLHFEVRYRGKPIDPVKWLSKN